MPLRFSPLALLVAGLLSASGSAQVTLTAAETLPYGLGDRAAVSYDVPNESGADTAALDALAAQAGADQTWDFTGFSTTTSLSATVTGSEGAVGPAAATAPLDQATSTYVIPLAEDDVEGTVYLYVRLASGGLYNLGTTVAVGEGGETFSFTIVNTPDGELLAPPSYTFGSTWESTFTEEDDLFGSSAEIRSTYEVDGWGRLVVPGVDGPVPALRVKVTRQEVGDASSQDVFYEFRTAGGIAASVDPDEGDFEPTASVVVVGAGSTAAERDVAAGYALGAPRPNPAHDAATLHVTVPAGGVAVVAVVDVLGREVVAARPVTLAAGGGPVRLDVGALPAGTYLARVTVDGRTLSRPLTVVR